MPETLTATTHVSVTRLAGRIGAEIAGADAGTPLSDEAIAKIRQALLDHKVVFLRGQILNYRRQVAFAERLGPLTLGHHRRQFRARGTAQLHHLVSQGSVASPDSIIESQTSLSKLIPAKLHYVPFEAGVTAIAEMKSGSVQAISGVGNPPLTEAIGSGRRDGGHGLGLRRRPAARAGLGDVARPAGR
jgi:hypothetical protein